MLDDYRQRMAQSTVITAAENKKWPRHDLKVSPHLPYLDHFVAIIDSDGGDELGGKDILIKSQHQ